MRVCRTAPCSSLHPSVQNGGRGEGQAHERLFTSLPRAAGAPHPPHFTHVRGHHSRTAPHEGTDLWLFAKAPHVGRHSSKLSPPPSHLPGCLTSGAPHLTRLGVTPRTFVLILSSFAFSLCTPNPRS